MRAPAPPQPLQIAQVMDMTSRLAQATRVRDWQGMHVIDRELAALLTAVRADQRWSPELHQAMTALRSAHLEAMLQCAMASEEMATHLTTTLSNKEGWMAYAANSDWNGSQA